jgi:hypothetical protein
MVSETTVVSHALAFYSARDAVKLSCLHIVCTLADNCVDVHNTDQENADNDDFGDACEPTAVDCGADADGDGIGDALLDGCDNCPGNACVVSAARGRVACHRGVAAAGRDDTSSARCFASIRHCDGAAECVADVLQVQPHTRGHG